ncbi:MAG: hypothetical protein ABSA13_08115 [Beijerinckiaceae bacterium]|jgi:hypothetical protein
MAIERVGPFIEFVGDNGLRQIIRVTAIQCIGDSDEMANETSLTFANKTVLIPAPLDEVREALMEDNHTKWRSNRHIES